LKDFIEDANVESEESGDEESRKRKRSEGRTELDDQLEDDDYDLLEENLGIKVTRVSH
jgi:transcription elongation factor SPT6